MNTVKFHVISLFPEVIQPYVNSSILGKAQKRGRIEVHTYNPMDYTQPRTKGALPQRVDQKPYGGGPGMVIRAEPVIEAVEDAVGRKRNVLYIHFAPRGESFSNDIAREIANQSQGKSGAIKDIVLICGRYEGIDSRIEDIFPGLQLSLGDFVLTGGEIPAMAVIDAVSRQLPEVLGSQDSREEERGQAPGKYYTRPDTIVYKHKTYKVPQVLQEGDHKKIKQWREEHH